MNLCLVAGVHPTIPAASGIRSYVLGLAGGLAARGHKVYLVGAGPATRVPFGSFVPSTVRFPLSNYAFVRSLWRWSRFNRVEDDTIIHAQRPDDLYPFVRHRQGAGWVCTLHGDPGRGVTSRRPLGRFLYRSLERRSLAAAHKVISVSESGLAAYGKRYPALSHKSSVIPVGIDLSNFHPYERSAARRMHALADRPTLLFAGRLEPEKRVSVILDALATMRRPPDLLIAGQGSQEGALRARGRPSGTRFLGRVPHETLPSLLSCADAVVLPSSYEGLPTIAVEALATGTPVISTAVGDLPRLVQDGKTGFLFDGTVAGLRSVLEAHFERLSHMREACRLAAQPYGWDAVVPQVEEVYRAIS